MIGFCEKALDRANGVDQAAFFADEVRYESALLNIERIGEAARRVPQEVRDANPHIPWRDIIDARNRIIHEYDRIDEDRLWETIRIGVADLLPKLRELADGG